MEFGITKELATRAKINNLTSGEEENPLFLWEAHYTTICGKKVFILMHVDTRYTMIFTNIKPSIWLCLEVFFMNAVALALEREGFTKDEVNRYFSLGGNIKITKTHGPKAMGGLKHLVGDLPYIEKPLVSGMLQPLIMDSVNDTFVSNPYHMEEKYYIPKELFQKRMSILLRNIS